jgi:D-alanyl-D-alanine carboxypeptidase/D-alanyl-D-alanine-endopeptidase (penicillin-binding protein 4)
MLCVGYQHPNVFPDSIAVAFLPMTHGFAPAFALAALLALAGLPGTLRFGHAAPPDAVSAALALPNASLMLEEKGQTRIARRVDRPMVPASTMKIVTALAAIRRWGLDHRFHTDFYRTRDGWLWVKGAGDPYLVSEELDLIVDALKRRGMRSVAGVGADGTLFAPGPGVSGRSSSNNPYDAPVTALAANFNTVNLVKQGGRVRSAESQTPLTPLARELGKPLSPGRHRVNLQERGPALRYFAELMAAKLASAGIQGAAEFRTGPRPHSAEHIYRHYNTRDLRAVLASMLEYSNNFIANDLFLLLGEATAGGSRTMGGAQQAMAEWVDETFGWRGHHIEDGAGLSRANRLSARQMLDAVKAFAPYIGLLPRQNARVRAKTGTLKGVSCYAGFTRRDGRWEPFSLLINQPVAYNFRLQVADALSRAPDISRYCPGASC